MFYVIVDIKGIDPRTFILEANSLDEAQDVYYEEVNNLQTQGFVLGLDAEIETLEVARFIDFA